MRKVIVMLLVLVIGAAVGANEVYQRWQAPLAVPDEGYNLTIAAGDSLRTVVNTLHEAGIVRDPLLIQAYGRWTGLDQKIKRGEYLLPAQATSESLLQLLQSGAVISYQLTLPEGITLARALAIMSEQPQLEHIRAGVDDPRIRALIDPHNAPEGLFFPDSYQYVRGDSDWSILQRAHRAMQEALTDEWREREPSLPYKDAYEALIMASIIERETGLPEERGEIAGVFVRRLQQGMRLQTDPTVIYGLGLEFDGNLRRRHLEDGSNPYNTYRHSGLPPSPIALPGRKAIHAALHPTKGKALYFVARGDGGHYFSATLAEHNRAVRKYQLRRREGYRSSPGK